jgi:hypothetical protein
MTRLIIREERMSHSSGASLAESVALFVIVLARYLALFSMAPRLALPS